MFGNKKGMYYTTDALLSSFLLIGVVILLINADFDTSISDQDVYTARDLATAMDQLKIYEIENDFLEQEINNGNISDLNQSLLELIGYYWSTNQTQKTEEVFNILAEDVLKDDYGVRLTIDDEVLVSKEDSENQNIYSVTRLLTGVDEEMPLDGASSSAYLKRIKNKKSYSYAYLGGFVGQGNISFLGEPLPQDINESRIEEIYLEGDFASNFHFYINGVQCPNEDGNLFNVNAENLSIDSWSLPSCKELIEKDMNEFEIKFEGDLEDSYAAGGLVRISYRTDVLNEEEDYGVERYNLPQIRGLANLFDSFYIKGILENMEVNLAYETNDSAYISIGERIIDLNNDEGDLEQGIEGEVTGSNPRFYNITLTNDFLKNQANLDYDLISNNTVPLRFSSYDTVEKIIESGDADVILISDYSTSMMRAIDNWGMGNRRSACEDALDDSETRRTDLATCLNKEFADNVLNYSGNRLWPVYMYDNDIKYYNNPEDLEAIKGYMGSFSNGRGYSCISCAVNQAYEILDQYSNESRKKFVVVMTDGIPTHCPDGSCLSESVDYGNLQCSGICNSPGNCPPNQRDSECQECIDNPEAANSLYFSSDRIVNDLDVTMFTIGFGPFENECDFAGTVLDQVAQIGNGTYQHSQDNEELQLIYENVSNEILTRIEQENQTVNVLEGEVESNLLNSYIDFEFQPLIDEPSPGKISVVMEEPLNQCNNTVFIPDGLEITDAKVASYSGPHWSDLVISNGVTVFNLSNYYVPYHRLGDPFEIHVNPGTLQSGYNNIFLETGNSPTNRTGCFGNDRLIYDALIPSATARTDVYSLNEGCSWTVAFEDGDEQIINVPSDYQGNNECFYQPDNIVYNSEDTYDVAMHKLLTQLDTNSNGRVLININELDLEVTTTVLEEVPFLWGPVISKLEVWK